MADAATHKMIRPSLRGALIALAAFGILVALGCWQIERLHWKEQLLATLDARLNQPPADFEQLPDPLTADEWAVVTVRGHYLPEAQVLVGPRTRDGVAGLHVFMPLELHDGRAVYINRGFVPAEGSKPTAPITTPDEAIALTGIIRLPAKGHFTPANDARKDSWYWPDLATMFAQHKQGVGEVQPVEDVYIQQTVADGEGYPMAVPATLDIPNDHRGYAIFWFSMAGLVVVFFWLVHRKRIEEKAP